MRRTVVPCLSRVLALALIPAVTACSLKLNGKVLGGSSSSPSSSGGGNDFDRPVEGAVTEAPPSRRVTDPVGEMKRRRATEAAREPRLPAIKQVALPAALGPKPMIVDLEAAASADFTKRWDFEDYACTDSMSPAPLVEFEVTAKTTKYLKVALDEGADGILIERPDGGAWMDCPDSGGKQPTVWLPKEGWAPGRYRVYLATRTSAKPQPREREVHISAIVPDRPKDEVFVEACFASYKDFRKKWAPVEKRTRDAMDKLDRSDFYTAYGALTALYRGLGEQSAKLGLDSGAAWAHTRVAGIALEVRREIAELQRKHGRDYGVAFQFNPDPSLPEHYTTGEEPFDRDVYCSEATVDGAPGLAPYDRYRRTQPWWLSKAARRTFEERYATLVESGQKADRLESSKRISTDSGEVRSMKRQGKDIVFVLRTYDSRPDCWQTDKVAQIHSDGRVEYQRECSGKQNTTTYKSKVKIAADRMPRRPAVKVGDWLSFDLDAATVGEGKVPRAIHVTSVGRGADAKTIASWNIGEMIKG